MSAQFSVGILYHNAQNFSMKLDLHVFAQIELPEAWSLRAHYHSLYYQSNVLVGGLSHVMNI